MNSLISHLMNLSSPEEVFNLEMTNFKDLPFHAFMKDTNGKYLACNDYLARDAGCTKGSELLGLTDFDMPWSNLASIIKDNDDRVKLEEKNFSFLATAKIHTGILCRHACVKAPLFSNNKKVIGVVGASFFLEEMKPISSLLPPLSKQQEKCLYYLAQGMTMKQIAKTLELSPKTVEHYLDALKIKLKCRSRSELVAYAIKIGILQ